MKKIVLIALVSLISLSSFGQLYQKIKKGNKRRVARIGNFEMSTQCMATSQGTTYTIRAFGEGDNVKDASGDAKFRAISDIMFRGIAKGKGGCSEKPLVFNPNLEDEKGSQMIGELLENKEETEKIIKYADAEGRVNSKKQSEKVIAFEFDVNVSALKTYFTNKGLIKSASE
ncbi:MAG: hypothetical protein ACKVOU_06575 [Cytophagales bacterium]